MGILITSGSGSLLALFKKCTLGLQYVADLFYTFYSLIKYEVQFTGQIVYMKRYLNDQFDNVSRRIYIYTNTGILSSFYYRKSEGVGDFVYRVSEGGSPFMQRKNEVISDYDFTVYVPVSLSYDSVQFNAAIEKYKLEDKTYNIVTF